MSKQRLSTRYMAVTAMFCAIAYVLVLLAKVIPNVAGFLSYEPKDVAVVIAGFILGPAASAIVSLIVSFIEMLTISTTGPYGLLMNVVSTCSFALPAAIIYKKHRTHRGAVAGLTVGVLVLAACMVAWNYIITPFYMGVPRAQVAGMLIPVFLPFNLIKGGLNAALTLLLYKPVVGALRKAKLIEESPSGAKKSFNLSFTLIAAAILVTFILLFLALLGVL